MANLRGNRRTYHLLAKQDNGSWGTIFYGRSDIYSMWDWIRSEEDKGRTVRLYVGKETGRLVYGPPADTQESGRL